MITAAGRTADGKPLLLMGITEENVERLKLGQPIRVPLENIHKGRPGLLPDIAVVIAYFPDQAAALRWFEQHGSTLDRAASTAAQST